jgi:hypothetical protein
LDPFTIYHTSNKCEITVHSQQNMPTSEKANDTEPRINTIIHEYQYKIRRFIIIITIIVITAKYGSISTYNHEADNPLSATLNHLTVEHSNDWPDDRRMLGGYYHLSLHYRFFKTRIITDHPSPAPGVSFTSCNGNRTLLRPCHYI